MILCTHKHIDHVGGNQLLKDSYSAVEIIGTKYETVPAVTKRVGHNDIFALGNLKFQVFHTPCHTKGHIAYLVTSLETTNLDKGKDNVFSNSLFCGDTLFVGGCGRFFEGSAHDMLKNMDFFGSLPIDTKVYCAHEYTEANLKFLCSVNPTDSNTAAALTDAQAKRKDCIPTVPTTIGEQLKYNLFMKCRETNIQALLSVYTAEDAMSKLRELKNDFQP